MLRRFLVKQQPPRAIKSVRSISHIGNDGYKEAYQRSIKDPEGFWTDVGKLTTWKKPFTEAVNCDPNTASLQFYADGELNVAENCIDRHLATKADQVALIWEKDEPGQVERITYQQLHDEVCRLANAYKRMGIKKGDVVTIYVSCHSRPLTTFLMLHRGV